MSIIKSIAVKFIGLDKYYDYGSYEEFESCPYFLWGLDIGEIRLLDNKDQTVIFDNKDDLDEYLERMARKAALEPSEFVKIPQLKEEVLKLSQESAKLMSYNKTLEAYSETLEAHNSNLEEENTKLKAKLANIAEITK